MPASPLGRGPAHLSFEAQNALARGHRTLLRSILALLLAAVLVVGILMPILGLRQNLTVAPLHEGASTTSAPAESGPVNVLLLGSDSRVGEADEEDSTARSDSLVLAHLDAEDSSIEAVQIPRDTLMDLPSCSGTGHGSFAGGRGMINSVLNYGPACSVKAVESLTGVRVDHFVEMDFAGFAGIVDALDGLPVCLPEPMSDHAADLDLPAGEQTLDGRQALALARTRHAVGDGSDIARLDHQQQVMEALVDRVGERSLLERPDRLYSFLDATSSSLTVDEGLGSISRMASLASRLSHVPSSQITFETMPWKPAASDPNRVEPSDDAAALFARIADDDTAEEAASDSSSASDSTSGSDSSSGSESPSAVEESTGSSAHPTVEAGPTDSTASDEDSGGSGGCG
jgi:LCP family protein required for cell wall assembly